MAYIKLATSLGIRAFVVTQPVKVNPGGVLEITFDNGDQFIISPPFILETVTEAVFTQLQEDEALTKLARNQLRDRLKVSMDDPFDAFRKPGSVD